MKDSAVMEIAVAELTGAVNQISQQHKINPTLMRFVMSVVMSKLNEMAISELSEEVIDLEIKVAKALSKEEKKIDDKEAVSSETETVTITPKSKSVRKSGTIDDLISDLQKNGVKVTKTHHILNPKTGEEIIEDVPYEPTGENNEVTK